VPSSQRRIPLASQQVRDFLDTVRQSIPSLLLSFSATARPQLAIRRGTVYQYTRFSTLRALLGGDVIDTPRTHLVTEAIWATSSVYLNDREEFRRGQAVLGVAIDNLPKGKVRTEMLQALRDADPLEVYVACFSAVDDDLSQWRGYGDNGAGVCLGFDLGELDQNLDGAGFWVIYGKPGDDDVQRTTAEALVKYLHGAITSAVSVAKAESGAYREIREQLTEIWPTMCLGFKHSDFAAEQEFRIVYSKAVGRTIHPSFRPPLMTPFVKLEMKSGPRLPLRIVRLGPAVSSAENVRSVALALERLGRGQVKVEPSGIPYVPR